jgi:hypothetical protein
MESDVNYFMRRAAEERAAASSASDPQARLIHLDLAARYEDLSNGITRHEEFLGLRNVHVPS